MLYLSAEVLTILIVFAAKNKRRRVEYRPLNAGHLSVQFDFPGSKIFVVKKLVYKPYNSIKALLGILNFVGVDIPHLMSILGEVLWQARIVTELWNQINSALFHVNEQKGLVGEFNRPVVIRLHVVNEICLVLYKSAGLRIRP